MSEAAGDAGPPSPSRIRIWDWPTRLFHWAIVLAVPAMWWTAETERVALHVAIGIGVLGLVLFRLLWGLLGSSTARFANFLKGPRAVRSYLNGDAAEAIGHNPLGGWSVAAMLVVLTAQVVLGLFAEDNDGLAAGPLSLMVSSDTAALLTELHELNFNLLLALIALHVGAILYYALAKRRNLVGPMLTGRGAAPAGAEPMRRAPWPRLLLALAIAAGVAAWLWSRL